MIEKSVIAIDCDDVLCTCLDSFISWYNVKFQGNLTWADLTDYRMYDTLGRPAEYWSVIWDLWKDDGMYRKVTVVPGAKEAIAELQRDFDLIVVTSRDESLREDTRYWLDQHFPNVFKSVKMTNSWTTDLPSKSKSQICIEEGAIALVDDYLGYCLDAATSVNVVCLFNHMGQNTYTNVDERKHSLPINIVEVHDWQRVVKVLRQQLKIGSCDAVSEDAETQASLGI